MLIVHVFFFLLSHENVMKYRNISINYIKCLFEKNKIFMGENIRSYIFTGVKYEIKPLLPGEIGSPLLSSLTSLSQNL